ncbi:MAG: hypothetical protein HOV80_14210, partial [Polyangiaceae bacterium]|nr:hypothetical protein [Polyangiaceae bacterium]
MRRLSTLAVAATCVLGAQPAHATSGSCTGGALAGTQPTDGQIDVPIDVRPRLLVDELADDPECLELFAYTTLALTKDGVPVAATEIDADGWVDIRELVPNAPLEPNTTYTLTVSAGTPMEISFTTGSRTTTPPTGLPELQILEAREDNSAPWHDGRALHQLSFRITPGQTDPDLLSLVRITQDDWHHAVFIVGSTDPIESGVHYWSAEGEPICLAVTQVSGNGAETTSERVCIEPEPAFFSGGDGCHAGRSSRG